MSMGDSDTGVYADPSEWEEFLRESNDAFLRTLERNVEAQNEFVDSWFSALERSFDESTVEEGVEGLSEAYQVWINAIEESIDRSGSALTGEDVELSEFRDLWLNAANEAFKEISATAAFAAMTGQTIEEALDLRKQLDEQAEETLSTLGFATRSDVLEVGERIIEVERRQQSIEEKLDEVIDRLDEQ